MKTRTALALVTCALGAVVFSAAILILAGEIAHYLLPVVAIVATFAIFMALLKWRVEGSLFGDLGFIYLGWALVYAVLPAFTFVIGSLRDGDPLVALLPSATDLGAHLWRHALFFVSVAIGYLLCRGRSTLPNRLNIAPAAGGDGTTIAVLLLVTAFSILLILTLSAPVESYYDHYTRFDHLPWLVRKIVSACIRFKYGLYSVLLALMFLNFKSCKQFILPVVVIICFHEVTFSFGARIQALIVLVQALCLYHFFVGRIPLLKVALASVAIGALFTAVEILRESGFDIAAARATLAEGGIRVASEFGLAFMPAFQLYMDRLSDSIPPVEWQMFFSDFISLFTFGDFMRWNPMDWYARNYYPDAIVAPFTLGPIADSAIWGGEVDLLFRGLVNGAFFAFIVRWFIRHQFRLWAVVVYVYCFATCVLTLKYSVFFHLGALLKNVLPILLLTLLIKRPFSIGRSAMLRPSRIRSS